MRWLLLATVFAFTFQFAETQSVVADDNKADPETVTIVYSPKNGPVGGFLKTLSRLLGPEAEVVELMEQNIALVRVPVDQQEKVSKLIQAVDVPRPVIRYRLFWFYTKNTLSPEQLATLSGPQSDVAKEIDQLESAGEIAEWSEFEASSLSNTECMVTKTNQQSVVTGMTRSSGGQAARSVKFVETGTKIQLRGLATGSSVLIDLSIDRSIPGKASAADDDQAMGGGAKSVQIQSTLQINDGDAQLVSAMIEESENENQNLYIILGAATK